MDFLSRRPRRRSAEVKRLLDQAWPAAVSECLLPGPLILNLPYPIYICTRTHKCVRALYGSVSKSGVGLGCISECLLPGLGFGARVSGFRVQGLKGLNSLLDVHCTYNLLSKCSNKPSISRVTVVMELFRS